MRLPRLLRPPLAALLAVTTLTACGGDQTTTPRTQKGQCAYQEDPSGAAKKVSLPPVNPPDDLPAEMTIATNRGDIKIALDAERAPCTVNAFVSLAKQRYYDGSYCHRLVTQGLLVLQCGDPKATGRPDDPAAGTGGPGYYIRDELVENDPRLQPCYSQVDPRSGKQLCTYTTGTVAMANRGPDTSGSQFFLVYRDSPLPNGYTVLGRMSAAGVKVVQGIAAGGAYPPTGASQNTAPRTTTQITAVR